MERCSLQGPLCDGERVKLVHVVTSRVALGILFENGRSKHTKYTSRPDLQLRTSHPLLVKHQGSTITVTAKTSIVALADHDVYSIPNNNHAFGSWPILF